MRKMSLGLTKIAGKDIAAPLGVIAATCQNISFLRVPAMVWSSASACSSLLCEWLFNFADSSMMGLTKLQTRYTSYKVTSAEEFNSASRSVRPGLIAAGIVSAWTWAATLLQSSAVAYKFGISGPWWYAAGACVQVLLFAMLAAKLKQNAPCESFSSSADVRCAHLSGDHQSAVGQGRAQSLPIVSIAPDSLTIASALQLMP
jgi:hypothetical protein